MPTRRGHSEGNDYCQNLTDEMKADVIFYRLENVSYESISQKLKTDHGSTYDRRQLSKWCNSEEGRALTLETQIYLREEWEKENWTQTIDRVHAMIQEARRLHRQLQAFPQEAVGGAKYTPISREWRAYMEAIGKEMKPFLAELPIVVKSPQQEWEQVIGEYNELKKEQEREQ